MRAEEIEIFRKAAVDLRCALVLSEADLDYFADKICAECQLAAEKFLKAALIASDIDHTETHNLPALLRSLIAMDQAIWSTLADDCELLNDRLSLRYSGFAQPEEALAAIKYAERIARVCSLWIEDLP